MDPATIIKAVLACLQALAPVIALLAIGVYGQRQAKAGAQAQAAVTTQATARAEVAIAQAEVAAPVGKPAILDRLKKGEF